MITPLPNLPAHVLGFSASGQITGNDYETIIIPAVEAALKQHDRVNLIYHLGDDFSGFDAAAIWDDAKIGLSHITSWGRIAMVSEVSWISMAVRAAGFIMPCPVRIFSNDELDSAIAWVSEISE